MIILRFLEEKDIDGMLEWMHNADINRYFKFDAQNVTFENAKEFIRKAEQSAKERTDFHFAIVNERDEYLGTISLKNIDWEAGNAEYAISVRKAMHGTGVAGKATQKILEYAFNELKLNRVYLNVLTENKRAICFYKKCGFVFEGEFRRHILVRGEIKDLQWYGMLSDEFKKMA